MKNLSLLKASILLFSLLIFTNCNEQVGSLSDLNSKNIEESSLSQGMTNIVSIDEYNSLSDEEKEVVDMINSSINGLKGYSINSKGKISNHYAIFNINILDKKSNNYVLISSKETLDYNKNNLSAKGQECTACGIGSGIKCGKKIISYISDNGLKELDVHIEVDEEGCYKITY